LPKKWWDLKRVSKDKENGPNFSLLAQTVYKWQPVDDETSKWEVTLLFLFSPVFLCLQLATFSKRFELEN
jgi:hypothetical protein